MKRKYKTRLEIHYIPRCLYIVRLKIGRCSVVFDPKDGYLPSVRYLDKTLKYISERKDYIFDYPNVLKDFADSGVLMLQTLEKELGVLMPKYVLSLTQTSRFTRRHFG